MSQVDTDLQNAMTSITQAVNDAAAQLKTLADEVKAFGSAPQVDPNATEAAAASLATLAANLESAVAGSKPAP